MNNYSTTSSRVYCRRVTFKGTQQQDTCIQAKDSYGRGILHWAARDGHLGVVQWLKNNIQLDKWASILVQKDNFYETALHYACRYNNKDVVELLLEVGEEVKQPLVDLSMSANRFGITALHYACRYNNPSAVKLMASTPGLNFRELCEKKETQFKSTALHWAVIRSLN